MTRRLYKVKLYGLLKEKFGKGVIELYGRDVREVFDGLQSRFGIDFRKTILDGAWHITTGTRTTDVLASTDTYLTPEEVDLPMNVEELHVFPAILGSGGKFGQIILGIVLIIVAVALAWTGLGGVIIAGTELSAYTGAVALAGVAALAGGVASLLASSPEVDNYADPDARQSFIFNGAVNNSEQGVPVPLVYGRHLTGSTIISAGIQTEQLMPITSVGAHLDAANPQNLWDDRRRLLGADGYPSYPIDQYGREIHDDGQGGYYIELDASTVIAVDKYGKAINPSEQHLLD